ncbi:MAG TPA: c-type cytochrome [Terriglobales bacterium]|nr:c-type cytochrome [Terriglobales bacterium]
MRRIASAVWVGLISLALATSITAAAASGGSKVERGKYLVEQVGMCGDCHTPHNEKGEPVLEKNLQGAILPFKPVVPIPVWADKSPNIAGLPGWEDKDAIKFMMTGIAYNDLPARPPMPQYRFNQEDATAILAYLRSLAPAQAGGHPRK